MLQTQVAYWTLQENVRHNKVTEAITQSTLLETIRHNKETERQGAVSLDQGWSNLNIQIDRLKNDTARVAIEKEKNELQKRSNEIAYMNAMSNATNAATNRYNAQTNRTVGYGNLSVSQLNASSQAKQAATSARQADNAAKANQIREQELKQRKTEMWVNAGSNVLGSALKLGGLLIK